MKYFLQEVSKKPVQIRQRYYSDMSKFELAALGVCLLGVAQMAVMIIFGADY